MSTASIIELDNLTKYYGAVVGVEGISFDVRQGEVFGFLGPNGAGKTTTIRMVLDLLKPTSGAIRIFGKDLASHSLEIRKRCGYLPGNFSAYSNLTGLEFLKLCADIRGVPGEIDRDLADRFGLSATQLGRKVKHLSHGTMQKLGIMQAFFHHPELLILDEPTIGLDPLMQEAFYDLLAVRRNEGSTVFISSHNLSEVERICARMAIIRQGRIVQVDSLENLRRQLHRKLKVRLAGPAGNMAIPGTKLLWVDANEAELEITGPIRPVLKALSELEVEEVVMPEPGLEEIFINYYREGEDG